MKSIIYLVLLIFIFLFSCKGKIADKNAENITKETNKVVLTNNELKNAGIESTLPKDSNVRLEKELNGIIDVPPQNNICVSFPMGGYLKWTSLISGMKVHKGQNIATMEDQGFVQLQQDYLVATSQLELKEAEYLRQKDLNESKTSSDKTFQLAKSEYEMARINKKALAEKLEILGINPLQLTFDNISKNVFIKAPASGIVSKVNVSVGQYINPSDVLFEIIDLSDIHLKLTAFESDAYSFQIGNEVVAYNNFENDMVYPAKIISINPSVNESSRSFDLHCHFNEKHPELMPGMYMNAKVGGAPLNVLLLPEPSVVSFAKKDFIFIDQGNNNYEMVEIDIVYNDHQFIGISIDKYSYLKSNKIVVKNPHFLLMKLKNSGD